MCDRIKTLMVFSMRIFSFVLLLCVGGVRSKQIASCDRGKVLLFEYSTTGLSAAEKNYMANLDIGPSDASTDTGLG
jgi:hypothetical protein